MVFTIFFISIWYIFYIILRVSISNNCASENQFVLIVLLWWWRPFRCALLRHCIYTVITCKLHLNLVCGLVDLVWRFTVKGWSWKLSDFIPFLISSNYLQVPRSCTALPSAFASSQSSFISALFLYVDWFRIKSEIINWRTILKFSGRLNYSWMSVGSLSNLFYSLFHAQSCVIIINIIKSVYSDCKDLWKDFYQDFEKQLRQKPSSMDPFMSYYVVSMTIGVSFSSFIGQNRRHFTYCKVSRHFRHVFDYEILKSWS